MGLNKVEKWIPGARWLRGYTGQDAVADVIAGITVGLTVLPQGLAYATLAGLEPQYGLYSAFMGGVVYALLGGCREVTIGPTALLSLMTSRHTGLGGESGPHLAILLCFLAGIVECVMGLLRLGALVDLISTPVTVGFTSATAVIIGASQLKGLLGLKGGGGSGFIATVQTVFTKADQIRPSDAALGICSIGILLLMRKLKDFKTPDNAPRGRRIFGGTLWLIGTSRNALLVFFTSLGAYFAAQSGKAPFILTGTVRSGLPDFGLPPFSTTRADTNGTLVEMDFKDMISELGASIALVPIIAVLGNVAISKAFGGSGIDATRELVALSLSNVLGSFVSSMPVTGSFSRSAVNHASGVRSPIGGVYTGALVLLALGLLTPYFHYIPRAALSAVIISAVIFMIEYEVIRPLWRCSRRELLPGAITFILSLWVGVEIGLLAGVVADLGFLVYRAARPALIVERSETMSGVNYILVRPRYSLLYFPAIEWVRSGISKAVKEHGKAPVVLDCRNLHEFDFTAARGLGDLHKELAASSVSLVLLGPPKEVTTVLKGAINTTISEAPNDAELDRLLQDLLSEHAKNEMKEIVVPLLNGNERAESDDKSQ
ncbi:sodium-independent sulfate anion transporter [Phlebotomus papatasi]|uniref:sodium-independent sulfate anion transporter n=1 Tax=Phlebotomus papatasi TaxID=29031 RepID=UPI0024843269|nr:sodium-independent sulfate anion transporter [Phlebotomus papatasi]